MTNTTPVKTLPQIRNQQVRGSSPRAGSKQVNNLQEILAQPETAGSLKGSLTRLLRWFGWRPAGIRRFDIPDDIATAQRIARLFRKVRG